MTKDRAVEDRDEVTAWLSRAWPQQSSHAKMETIAAAIKTILKMEIIAAAMISVLYYFNQVFMGCDAWPMVFMGVCDAWWLQKCSWRLSRMSWYLTEPIDSSMCVRFTLAGVNWRIGRTTEMMLMYSNVLFVQKYPCDQNLSILLSVH